MKQDTQKTQRIQHPDWIIKERENIIEFLKELIKTPSLSGQEKEIAELIQRKMVELGYTVHVDDMGNVIGIIGKGRHTVLFDSHMDHISPGTLNNWKFPPYSGKIIDKEMYGRGVVDMKGAVASLIYGCANSKDDVKKILACVVHEETNEGVATRKIIDEYNGKIDSCVLGEPTDLKLSIGQRGRAVFKITTHGLTSHSSMPEHGNNAIYLMNPIIDKIKELNNSLSTHPLMGSGSVAVTEISCEPGGGPIIPDICAILIDRRTILGEDLESIRRELEKISVDAEITLLKDKIECYTGYKIDVEQYFPSWLMDRKHPYVRKCSDLLKKVLGMKPEIITWRFSTDGVATAGEYCIPTIGFGPGDPNLAHQPNEKIRVDDVLLAAHGYSELASII